MRALKSREHRTRRKLRQWWLVFCAAGFGIFFASHAVAQRVFFADRDPVVVKASGRQTPDDYMQLFHPDAPWEKSASKVYSFSVPAQFVLSGTDEQLRAVFLDMKRRGVRMGLEMGTVVRLDSCGKGEGYAPQGMAAQLGKRLRSLGLGLDYMVADEPLSFAHFKYQGTAEGNANCLYPIATVVERTMMSVNEMRKYFPDIEVGSIEVAAVDPKISPQQRIAGITEFLRLMSAALGKRVAFFHADIAWATNPVGMIAPLRQAVKAQGIPFGAIVSGGPKDMTDVAWEMDALNRMNVLMSNPATRLDDIAVDSWQPRPTKILPETTPGTSTNVLLRAENESLANAAK